MEDGLEKGEELEKNQGESPVGEEKPIGGDTETVIPPDLQAEIDAPDTPDEVELLRAKIQAYEEKYAGLDEKAIEIARNPKEYVQKTEEMRKKIDFMIPESEEELIKSFLVESGQVKKENVKWFFQKTLTYNEDIIKNFDKDVADEEEKAIYEEAVKERDVVLAELKEKAEAAKSFFQKQKEDAQEALEKIEFHATTREATASLSEITEYKTPLKYELRPAVVEDGKEKIPAVYLEHTVEIPKELIEATKDDLKKALRNYPKENHADIINTFFSSISQAQREQELVKVAYESGVKKMENDKKLLLEEVKRLKKELQTGEKIKIGLVQPPVEKTTIEPQKIEKRA